MATLNISYGETVKPFSNKFISSIKSIFHIVEEKYGLDSSVEVVFINDAYMESLNSQFRQKDGTTDVLSFDLGSPFRLSDDTVNKEIYISVEQAFRQAVQLGISLTEELTRLFLHGLLHLYGWKHETEAALILMENEAESLLQLIESPGNH
tara:strand:- start:2379 stop:2831 length:453 start_codon:yes stop_codon:yes gene_type:complete